MQATHRTILRELRDKKLIILRASLNRDICQENYFILDNSKLSPKKVPYRTVDLSIRLSDIRFTFYLRKIKFG